MLWYKQKMDLSIEELLAQYFYDANHAMEIENELIDRIQKAPSLAGLLETARAITSEVFRTYFLDIIFDARIYESWQSASIAQDKLAFLETEMRAYLAYVPAADDDLDSAFFTDMPQGREFLAAVMRLGSSAQLLAQIMERTYLYA